MADENRAQIPDPEWEAFLAELNGDQHTPQAKGNPTDNFSTAERPLNPAEAREEAKRLWRMEQELLEFAENYPYAHKSPTWKYHIEKIKSGLIISSGSMLEINLFHTGEGNPIGKVIRLSGYPAINEFELNAGVKDSVPLVIVNNSDGPTLDKEDELDDLTRKNLVTKYYFNSNGDFWKISRIPLIFLGDRRRLVGNFEDNIYTYIQGDMVSGDFELAGLALQTLKNQLKPKEEPQIEEK